MIRYMNSVMSTSRLTRPRNWREWFISPSEDTPTHEQAEEADIQSGAQHKDFDKLQLKKPTPPRCASCKRFMGYSDGMYIIVSGDWRLHISCFETVVERHFEDGEVIDLTTGQIVKVDKEKS